MRLYLQADAGKGLVGDATVGHTEVGPLSLMLERYAARNHLMLG